MKTKQLKGTAGAVMLYIVEATTPHHQWIKIGITTELIGRVKMIACGCPIPIDAVWYRDIGRGEVADWAETAVHAALADRWTSGEWFAIASNEVLRVQIDAIVARFIKPQPWKCERFDESPWRNRSRDVRSAKLGELAERRAQGIEQARKARRETPFKMDAPLSEIHSIYKS
jgi:hypothetical protein